MNNVYETWVLPSRQKVKHYDLAEYIERTSQAEMNLMECLNMLQSVYKCIETDRDYLAKQIKNHLDQYRTP